jgi:hypothetical protein
MQRGYCASRFCDSLQQKGGEQKSRGKIKFMGKNWEALLYIRDYEYP